MRKGADGGPAFPVLVEHDVFDEDSGTYKPSGYVTQDGMSLRDYFAAKAMQALVGRHETDDPEQAQSLAYLSYKAADALLKVRAQ